jgi:hypothetical protein
MCGCKHGKAKRLNNLESLDHLKMASDVYTSVVLTKEEGHEYDSFDQQEIFSTYTQLYPNQKIKPTLEQAIGQLKHAHEQYQSKKR